MVEVPESNGKRSFAEYAKRLLHVMETAFPLAEWLEAQRDTILSAPRAQLLLIARGVVKCCTTHATPVPEWIARVLPQPKEQEPPPAGQGAMPLGEAPKAAAPTDPDRKWAEVVVDEVKSAKDVAAVRAIGAQAEVRNTMASFKRNRPELFKLVDDAFALRIKEAK